MCDEADAQQYCAPKDYSCVAKNLPVCTVVLPLLIDRVAAEATLTEVSCTLWEAARRLLVALRVMRVALRVTRPMLRDTVWLLDIPEASESASSELPSS